MVVVFTEQEDTAFLHELNNLRVGFEHIETREVLHFRREFAGVVNRAVDIEAVFLPDNKIVVAVAWRGMHTTGPSLTGRGFLARIFDIQFGLCIRFAAERHVLAQHQQRWPIKPGVTALQTIQTGAPKARQYFRRCEIALRADNFQQFTGNDVNLSADLNHNILKIGMHRDAQVGRQSPWRRRPDQYENFASRQCRIDLCGIACQRKLYVNGRATVLLVFDFGFSEGSLIVDTPVNGARALVDKTSFDKAREKARRLGFVVVRHRNVRIVPLAEDSQPLKIAGLPLQSIGREFATRTSDAKRRHAQFLLAKLALDMKLNRQTMTVVAGNVGRVVTEHRARLNDEVFQDFVERGAQMNVGVRVRRPVVQDELFSAGAGTADLLVKFHLGPLFQTRRLALRQVSLLREFGLRQVDGFFKFQCRRFSGHVRVLLKSKR